MPPEFEHHQTCNENVNNMNGNVNNMNGHVTNMNGNVNNMGLSTGARSSVQDLQQQFEMAHLNEQNFVPKGSLV